MPVKLRYHLDLAPESKWNMISATAMAKASLVYAQEVGDFIAGPGYDTAREGYASYLIKLTVDGCGYLEYNGQSHQLTPGQIFWIDCRRPQFYRTAPNAEGWHTMWVHFYGANSKAYYDAFLTHNNGSNTAMLPNLSTAVSIFTALLSLDPATPNQMMQDFHAANHLTRLMTECVLATMSERTTGDLPHIIQGVRMYLQNNFNQRHTLEALGSRFNINPHYLQKQFKRHMGISPSEYVILLRMTRAKELLRSTKLSIGEIAYAVGIENQSYFTRQFKETEGLSPQDYRKLWPTLRQPFSQLSMPDRRDINRE